MALFGENIETRRDLFVYKVGAALTMEKTILEMIPQLEEHAQNEQLRAGLEHHRVETERHVQNLESVFRALDEDVDDSSCPAIEGIEKEGQANLKMVDDSLNDMVILSGVAETEHHEIAAYENLITAAKGLGETQAVTLLEENLSDEQAMLQRGKEMSMQMAQGAATV
jgi:ferritin-like metal-binding protein YciE